jgi:hypothetical protein
MRKAIDIFVDTFTGPAAPCYWSTRPAPPIIPKLDIDDDPSGRIGTLQPGLATTGKQCLLPEPRNKRALVIPPHRPPVSLAVAPRSARAANSSTSCRAVTVVPRQPAKPVNTQQR